jgi:hypothetical protein
MGKIENVFGENTGLVNEKYSLVQNITFITYLLITYLLTYLLTHSLTHSLTYSLTHSLTPYSTGLLEKLTVFQLVKKFPTFYETGRFINAFTSARYLSLS